VVEDAVLPHALRPGCREVAKASALRTVKDVEYETNTLGLRGPEIVSGKELLLVLGDSFTEGFGLSNSDTFPARLEQVLHTRGLGQVQVINGGVTGYSTAVYPLLFQKKFAAMGIRCVLLNFDFSDLADDIEFLSRARYDESGQPVAFPRSAPQVPHWLAAILYTHRSAVMEFVCQEIARAHNARLRRDSEPSQRRLVAASPQLIDPRWLKEKSLDRCWEQYELTAKMILRLKEEVEQAGASFAMHVYLPGGEVKPYPPDGTKISFWAQWEHLIAPNEQPLCRFTVEGIDVLRRFAAAQGIPFFDSSDVVRHSPVKTQLYFDLDTHWTGQGAAVVAEAVAGWLVTILPTDRFHRS